MSPVPNAFLRLLPLMMLAPMLPAAESPVAAGGFIEPNPQIDPKQFMADVRASMMIRELHRVSWADFIRMSGEPGTIVLDARNPEKFRLIHFKGAKNLDFTLFTATELAKVIPAKTTRVLIYCNNNFVDNSPATATALGAKAVSASLNLMTFSNLYAYGYRNVYELGPVIDLNKDASHMTGTLVGPDGKLRQPEKVEAESEYMKGLRLQAEEARARDAAQR